MYPRITAACFIVLAVILGYLELVAEHKAGLALAAITIGIAGIWLSVERHRAAQASLIDMLESKIRSSDILIEQKTTYARRKEAELSEANAQITRQMSTINGLERRLRDATSLPRNPGFVSTREAILEPTPPARMGSLPGFDQNRVPREERTRTLTEPRMGDHYRETIRDDADNGLGSFALGALVGSMLSDDAKVRCEPETPTIEPGGGSFGGAGASASWSEPARSEPAYESPSYSDNSSSSNDSSPSGD